MMLCDFDPGYPQDERDFHGFENKPQNDSMLLFDVLFWFLPSSFARVATTTTYNTFHFGARKEQICTWKVGMAFKTRLTNLRRKLRKFATFRQWWKATQGISKALERLWNPQKKALRVKALKMKALRKLRKGMKWKYLWAAVMSAQYHVATLSISQEISKVSNKMLDVSPVSETPDTA